MFNIFQYSLNHLLLNKRNTDSQAVCNAENTFEHTRSVPSTESSKLAQSAFQNLTFADWFH